MPDWRFLVCPRRGADAARSVTGPEIERLIQLLAKLPGLGPRSARRAALISSRRRTSCSPRSPRPWTSRSSGWWSARPAATSTPPTPARSAPTRAATARLSWSSKDVADLWALERAGALNAPLPRARRRAVAARRRRARRSRHRQAGPPRGRSRRIHEVILAVNATVEGQTTAHYIMDRLAGRGGEGLAPGARRAGRRRARLSRRRHARRGDPPAHAVLSVNAGAGVRFAAGLSSPQAAY